MLRLAPVVAAAALLLAGCVVRPPLPHEILVTVPPPAPIVEVVPPAPAVGYIWIEGFWGWVGGRHVWQRGYWAPPRPGYRYVPRRWEPVAGGWHERGGHWDQDRVR